MSEVTNNYPSLTLRVCVDEITALVKGKNQEVVEMANKGHGKAGRRSGEKKGIKLSVTENGKEGKSKMVASCGFLENELSQFSKEGVPLADSVETLGVDFRTRVKKLGAKEKARRKKCKVRFSIIKKNGSLQKDFHESGCQEVGTCRHDASKDLESPCGWDVSRWEVEIEKTDGSCCRKKEYDLPIFVHGSTWPRCGRRALHHGHSVLSRRSMDRKMELRAKRSSDEADSRGSNVEASERAWRSGDVRNP